jgi:hypothetical protein
VALQSVALLVKLAVALCYLGPARQRRGRSLAVMDPNRRAQERERAAEAAARAMSFRKVALIALGGSVSLLMGCTTPVRQCDPANVPGSNCYLAPGPPYRN